MDKRLYSRACARSRRTGDNVQESMRVLLKSTPRPTSLVPHTEEDLRWMFDRLWNDFEAQDEGLVLQIFGVLCPEEALYAGTFVVPEGRDPHARIILYRQHQRIPGDPLEELLTLAHEIGHYRSWREGRRSVAYDEAVRLPHAELCTMSDEAKRDWMAEEQRAWDLGQEELAKIGFADVEALQTRALRSLNKHREVIAAPEDA